MPSGRRTREPVRMGVATSRPNSVSLRLSSALILIPMTENITQTAKFTAKASVLADSAEICSRLYPGLLVSAVVTIPPCPVDCLPVVGVIPTLLLRMRVDGGQDRTPRSAMEPLRVLGAAAQARCRGVGRGAGG